MHRFEKVLLLIGFICVAFFLSKGRKSEIPGLEIDETHHDFGVISPGQIAERTFDLRNNTAKEVVLKSVSTSCKCTVAALKKTKLQPHEVINMLVRIRGARASGKMVEEVIVVSTDEKYPVQRIIVEALVDSIVEIRPSTLECGILTKDDLPKKLKVDVYPVLGRRLDNDVTVLSDSKYICGSIVRKSSPERYELNAILKKDVPIGPINAQLWIKGTGILKYTAMIPVGGKIVGNVRMDPETFYLGNVTKSKPQNYFGEIIFLNSKANIAKYVPKIFPESARDFLGVSLSCFSNVVLSVKTNAPLGRLNASIEFLDVQRANPVLEVPIIGVVSSNELSKVSGI